MSTRDTILIVDNIEMNRAILRELLKSKYKIIEAESSSDAIAIAEQNINNIAVILLDMGMPDKSGIEILQELKNIGVTNIIPTVLMSAEFADESLINGHELGACDILEKPFEPHAVLRQIDNIVDLYSQKNKLEQLLKKQATYLMQQNEKIQNQQNTINNMNTTMLDTLSTLIEYRDVESGKHVQRIRKFTEILLRAVAEKYPEYSLTEDKINLISSASSMHDIGKIAIPDSILLAPRRLTYDEFRIMKGHTTKGCEILNLLKLQEKDEYFQYCYDICRYHHEKWDGMGYPDGLRGDDIPICAQVVSVADCYDALTSERPYKAAIPHKQAAEMIKTGACGTFSDSLMECFNAVLPQFEQLAQKYADTANNSKEKQNEAAEKKAKHDCTDTATSIYSNMSREELIEALERQKQVAKETHERDCQIFYRINNLVFECNLKHDNFYVRKGNWEKLYNYYPKNYTEAITMISSSCHPDDVISFKKTFRLSNVKKAVEAGKEKLEFDGRFMYGKNSYRWYRCILIPFCEDGKLCRLFCCASKISEKNAESGSARYKDQHDSLTGLWNINYMQKAVDDYLMHSGKDGMHILINIDIDDFKALNMATNVTFGDEVLCKIAEKLKNHFKDNSLIARADSDCFAVFLRDCLDVKMVLNFVEELYNSMHLSFEYLLTKQNISVSMGVAQYPTDGTSFTELMNNADFATEMSKLRGKDMYLFYNKEMRKSFEEKPSFSLISNEEKVNIYDFKRIFIPAVDSKTGVVVFYDYLELPSSDVAYSPEDLCEMVSVSDNITALGLNSLKRLLTEIYTLQNECGVLPEISLYTMFKGSDAPVVLKVIANFISEHPLNCSCITLNITQDMLNTMSYRELVNFSTAIRAFGFKIGLFSFGLEYINVKCFTEKLFDSVVFSSGFINGIVDGLYPSKLLKFMFDYFLSSGVSVSLPQNTSAVAIETIRKFCGDKFVYRSSKSINADVFRMEMEINKNIPKAPMLCHEKYELALTINMYSEIFKDMKFIIFRWQLKNDKVWFSDSYKEIYGIEPPTENLIDYIKSCENIYPDDRQKYVDKLLAVRAGFRDAECFVRIIKKSISDKYRWSKIRLSCIINEQGIPESVVGFETDVDDERQEHLNMRSIIKHDFLTQLFNKDTLKHEINSFLRTSEGEKEIHAFMIIDIDNFKSVYDQMGEIFSDAVLMDITKHLKNLFRESDIIGRVGRDQFVIFVKNIESRDVITKRAESVCNILKQNFESEENTISVSGSIGISIYPQNGTDFDELYRNSSTALFSIKHRGKNNWLFYSEELLTNDE